MSFRECAACAAKPGAPILCESCLHNRALIEKLEEDNDRLRRERAEALTVHTKEGLLASEWVARTGKAEAEVRRLRERECYGDFDSCVCRYHEENDPEPMGVEE